MVAQIDFLGASQAILGALERRREREEAERIFTALSGKQETRLPQEQGVFSRVLGGENPFAPGPRGRDSQPLPSLSPISKGKTPVDPTEAEAYIRQSAAKRGIDPDTAVRVARSEGLSAYVGDEGSSFGPFQLHYGGVASGANAVGGLGDEFTKVTGLHARDPSTWKQQVDFSLDQAAKGGWGPWHGAQRVGIADRQGIGGAVAMAGAPSQIPPVGTGAAQTPAGQAMPQYSMDVIMRALMNPRTQALGQALLSSQLRSGSMQIIDVPVNNEDGSFRGTQKAFVDPRTGRVAPFGGVDTSGAPKAPALPSAVQEFEYAQKHPDFVEYQKRKVAATGLEADVAERRRIGEGVGLQGDELRTYELTGKLPAAYEKQTESQATSAIYADRMKEADKVISNPAFTAAGTSLMQQGLGGIPGIGNLLISENRQLLDQAKRDFVNAVLRKESGAVISQSEFENASKQYFPQPGDSQRTIAQKEQNRATAIRGISNAAGPAYKRREGEAAPLPAPAPEPPPSGARLGSVKIPPAAAQELRAKPETRAQFDEIFGAGAADQVLGPLR